MKSRAWDEAAVAAFAPVADGNPWGAIQCAGELVHGCYLFEYAKAGQHALVAALPVHASRGRRLEIVALRSLGDRLQAGPFIGELVKLGHAMDANVVAMSSAVPHVINTCTRHGWIATGTLMQYRIGEPHGRPQ